MTIRHIPALPAALVTAAMVFSIGSIVGAAQPSHPRIRTLVGAYDAEIPYPAQEGLAGQRDPAAVAAIQLALSSSVISDDAGVEFTGILTVGPPKAPKLFPTTFAVEKGRRFRMDIQKADGVRSVRLDGSSGRTQAGNQSIQVVQDVDFGHPLSFPLILSEFLERKDAAIVYDGSVMIEGRSMSKVTITLFPTHLGTPISSCFYFDSESHLLAKSAFIGHSLDKRPIAYLGVMTFGDYHKDQSLLLPHEYVETADGQKTMQLSVTSINVSTRHDRSYFGF